MTETPLNPYGGESLIRFHNGNLSESVRWEGSRIMLFVNVLAVFVGAIGGLQFIWQFFELTLAFVVLCNIIPLFFLYKDVVEITDDYIIRFYEKKPGKKRVTLFHEKEAKTYLESEE